MEGVQFAPVDSMKRVRTNKTQAMSVAEQAQWKSDILKYFGGMEWHESRAPGSPAESVVAVMERRHLHRWALANNVEVEEPSAEQEEEALMMRFIGVQENLSFEAILDFWAHTDEPIYEWDEWDSKLKALLNEHVAQIEKVVKQMVETEDPTEEPAQEPATAAQPLSLHYKGDDDDEWSVTLVLHRNDKEYEYPIEYMSKEGLEGSFWLNGNSVSTQWWDASGGADPTGAGHRPVKDGPIYYKNPTELGGYLSAALAQRILASEHGARIHMRDRGDRPRMGNTAGLLTIVGAVHASVGGEMLLELMEECDRAGPLFCDLSQARRAGALSTWARELNPELEYRRVAATLDEPVYS